MANAHDFSFAALNGTGKIELAQFAGSAILVVNVASACGFTPQYSALEALYQARAGKGLTIIGVPCNDFGAQEPGTDAEIREFCDTTYHVTFPMAAKAEIVPASRRHPFYAWIAEQLGESALPRWNFHKFLVGKAGQLIEAFPSKVAPLGPEMIAAVDLALAG